MASIEKAHILYLEDDPESVELVKFTLAAAGIDVTVVDTPEEALSLARGGRFDLFLLDGLLPSGYSFDIGPELRAAAPNVPIVFYTALGFPAEVQQGTDAGADAYLLKPFMGNLAETLSKIIADSKRTRYSGGYPTPDCFRIAVP
jgi:DNA-binding response OmpR family regulator